jgi:hypothetical protein
LGKGNSKLGPLQRGDNYKNAKMGWGHLKTFSRTTEPEELKCKFRIVNIKVLRSMFKKKKSVFLIRVDKRVDKER